MISVQNLIYEYAAGKKMSFPDFALGKGEHFLLLGQSGSGKTTLLHLLGGLLKSQRGDIKIQDINITTLPESAMDHFRGKHMGFVFQRNHLIAALTVRENLLLSSYLAGVKQNEARVEEVLHHLDITEKRDSKIKSLSQGQAQRVAIARAVMNRPALLLCDEPTSALDDKNCERVIELLIKTASQEQTTLLVATHDQRLKSKLHQMIQL